MAFAPDGLLEGFCDPDAYNPEEGKFIMGSREFVSATRMPKSLKLDGEMEKKRKIVVKSFSVARNMSKCGHGMKSIKESDLKAGAEFLETNKALSPQQEARLLQIGAMIRNGSFYLERPKYRF